MAVLPEATTYILAVLCTEYIFILLAEICSMLESPLIIETDNCNSYLMSKVE